MSVKKSPLKASTTGELLSYIINSNPVLSDNIDLPVQGQDYKPIGKLISSNQRYKNAFLNTVNLIGLTVAKRNRWDNPWDFTLRGTLRHGQQVRELISDLVEAHDYNKLVEDTTYFLKNFVPNIFNYIHDINFQKFYATTTSDEQMSMAFESEESLYDFIENIISMNWESYIYDCYIVDKYMLCQRILSGTVTPTTISNYETLTARQRVSALKSVSNDFTFRSPNYNPSGIRKATSFEDQILIVSTEFEADFTTEVLATSFFKDEADMRARLVLCDGFANHDIERLTSLLGEQFVPFKTEELAELKTIPAVLISYQWFMDYNYELDVNSPQKSTDWYNPTTLRNNHFLHAWRIFSTSPFENATVFTPETASVTAITVNPATATITKGQSAQFTASAATTGFANQSVTWKVTGGDEHITISNSGLLKIGTDTSSETVTVVATSIFNKEVSGQATVTIS